MSGIRTGVPRPRPSPRRYPQLPPSKSNAGEPLVRAAAPSDARPVCTLLNEVVARGDAFLYDTPSTIPSAREWMRSHTAAFVAEQDGTVVGAYVRRPNQQGRGSHVCNAAYTVAESARGGGIGKQLGEHSLIEARRLGFRSMQFNAVVSTNSHAVALWQSLGFQIVGTVPNAFRHPAGKHVDLFLMHREL